MNDNDNLSFDDFSKANDALLKARQRLADRHAKPTPEAARLALDEAWQRYGTVVAALIRPKL
jgi:hypothetical protein